MCVIVLVLVCSGVDGVLWAIGSILDVSESFSAGPTGSEAVYTVDLVICARTHVIAAMFILSGPNASLWCKIKSKYVVVFPRTVAL